MQINGRTQKTIFKILTILLLVGMALALFHHHADGQPSHDCAVCRLAAQIFCTVLFAVALIICTVSGAFFTSAPKTFSSFLLTPNLLGRAPPVLL